MVSTFVCGTDAHVVDSENNIVIESSSWTSEPEKRHKIAMELICKALNKEFKPNP